MLHPVPIPPLLAVIVITVVYLAGAAVGVVGYRYWLAHRPADLAWWPLTVPAPTGRHHLADGADQYRPRSAADLPVDEITAQAAAYEYNDLTDPNLWDDDEVTAIIDAAVDRMHVRMAYEVGRVPCSWHADSRYGYVDHCLACTIANDTTEVLAAVK